jgi:SAM-dependent methyltransferase
MSGPTSGYDGIASIYNRHWRRFSVLDMRILDALLLHDVARGAHVLDLCCGTGQLAAQLTERCYRVTGLDVSEGMLAFARANAPSARFIHADARDFALDEQVDAVISTSDSLNHITDLDGFEAALRCVQRSLRPGGRFLFDLNTEEKYISHWVGSFGIVEDDEVCVVRVAYDQQTRLARFDATMFFDRGGWEREDLRIDERCYSEDEVRNGLARAGFTDLSIHDCRDIDPDGEPAKIFVVCRA